MSLHVRSGAFALEDIPVEYTGDGRNISPPLEWTPGPEGTTSYAVILDDPDGPGGTWVHWILWNVRDPGLPTHVACQPQVDTAFGRVSQGRPQGLPRHCAPPCHACPHTSEQTGPTFCNASSTRRCASKTD